MPCAARIRGVASKQRRRRVMPCLRFGLLPPTTPLASKCAMSPRLESKPGCFSPPTVQIVGNLSGRRMHPQTASPDALSEADVCDGLMERPGFADIFPLWPHNRVSRSQRNQAKVPQPDPQPYKDPVKSPQPDPQPYTDPVKEPPFDPPDERPLTHSLPMQTSRACELAGLHEAVVWKSPRPRSCGETASLRDETSGPRSPGGIRSGNRGPRGCTPPRT
jgi:hypothetical protein